MYEVRCAVNWVDDPCSVVGELTLLSGYGRLLADEAEAPRDRESDRTKLKSYDMGGNP